MSEALTKAAILSPKSKDSAGKAPFWALSTSTSHTLINHIPSLRLKILSRFSIHVLHPSPETPTKALLFCSVNKTVTTLKSWFQTTPPKSCSTLLGDVYPGMVISNNAQLQPVSVHSQNIVNIKIQGTKPLHMHLQARCTFLPKLHQRQNRIVFKTRMAKTHMKELRTLKTFEMVNNYTEPCPKFLL